MGAGRDRIRLVVFDWAGTTVDFGCRGPALAFMETFATFKVEVTPDEARGPMGLHKKDHLREMLRMPAVARRWAAAHGREWEEADVEAMYRDVTPRQQEAAARRGEPVPELLACVAKLRERGIKIGGTTGYFREAAEAAAKAAAGFGYVPDFTICADEVPAGRPGPWMVFRVMEQLGVYPPSVVVKVGDTCVDIAEGLNAGAWSVGVIDSGNEMGCSLEELGQLASEERDARRAAAGKKLEGAGAHAVIRSLAELPSLLDQLEGRLRQGATP